jgi:hypothetical protein
VPWHKIRLNDSFEIIHTSSSVWFAMGYYIDIQAANTMFRLTKKIFCVADEYDYFRKFIKLRVSNKAVVFENSHVLKSVIGDRTEIINRERYNDMFSRLYQRILRSRLLRMYNYLLTLFH